MSGLDVEALLESTAATVEATPKQDDHDDRSRADNSERRDRDRSRDRRRRRERSRDRRRDRDVEGDEEMKSPPSEHGSANGSHRSRKRSRSRESERRRPRRDRDRFDDHRSSGDFYRGGGRAHSRSRSPHDDRHYRPSRRERDDDRRPPRRERDARRQTPRRSPSKSPELNEDERDKRTIFVQQLAARLRTKELMAFFEKVGPVKEAQIVKDRVSGRSKGVGYVEFKSEESVPAAIQLTGQKLLGIPIIAQLTEAEKNRQARNPEASSGPQHSAPFHRLYVGNVHFSITETDLQNVFEPFGELEFVQLQKDETGRSKGYAFVQFRDPNQAREALEKMNGFDLAGRAIRVGLGNDKFTPDSSSTRPQGSSASQPSFQGSSFSGHGGRGVQAGGSNNFDRAGGRESEKGTGASALDDTDVAGVNFNNYSRDALMRKLARTDEPEPSADEQQKILRPKTETKPLPVNVNMASRCVMLRNMFDASEEEGEAWIKELEDDVRSECEEKYGHVVHISLDPSSQGDIYLKFDRVQGGENAIKGLNGRFFGGKQITAQPVVDAVYSSLFSRTKAI
ncbi:uncharacterized protein N7483_006628 [Penicillium malachiteum]|uniref:uncharacterized protein n=1 Tax=Penicillium malachiteum TaxID=1324776 RepID=UPI002547E393|nr:uncharacterized protein N7483_006628 [Penicillium malachiteum]KAJ5725271.1 hypothetical protein N7483_006628 [Penicillium malachiteum]